VKGNQKYRILLVDDEPTILDSMAMVLESDGYEVATAKHGFDALEQLAIALPDLLISDLNMPEMSGFELLLIVRQRFPSIPLMAISGVYDSAGCPPEGVVADAFYAKGRHRPETLLRTVAELIRPGEVATPTRPCPPPLMQFVRD
jgi:CheY-like chemotaxis protein